MLVRLSLRSVPYPPCDLIVAVLVLNGVGVDLHADSATDPDPDTDTDPDLTYDLVVAELVLNGVGVDLHDTAEGVAHMLRRHVFFHAQRARLVAHGDDVLVLPVAGGRAGGRAGEFVSEYLYVRACLRAGVSSRARACSFVLPFVSVDRENRFS